MIHVTVISNHKVIEPMRKTNEDHVLCESYTELDNAKHRCVEVLNMDYNEIIKIEFLHTHCY